MALAKGHPLSEFSASQWVVAVAAAISSHKRGRQRQRRVVPSTSSCVWHAAVVCANEQQQRVTEFNQTKQQTQWTSKTKNSRNSRTARSKRMKLVMIQMNILMSIPPQSSPQYGSSKSAIDHIPALRPPLKTCRLCTGSARSHGEMERCES